MLATSVPGAQRALARHLRRQRPPSVCSSNTSTACFLGTGRRELVPMMTRPAGSVVFRSQHIHSRRKKYDAKLRVTDDYPTPKQGLPFYQKVGLTALLAAGALLLIEYRKGQRRAQSEPLENQPPEEGTLEILSADDLERAARAAEQRQNLRQILAGMSSSGGGKNAGDLFAGGLAGVSRAPPEGRYSYVIIGAGTTANAAVEAILQMQPDADILLLSDEMPTSVEDDMLGGNDAHEANFQTLNTDLVDSYNQWRRHVNMRIEGFTDGRGGNGGFGLGRGEGIRYHKYQPGGLRIEPERRSISLDDGVEVFYDKCLFANAGKPRKFYAALDSGHLGQDGADDADDGDNPSRLKRSINTLLSLEDFVCLEKLADDPSVKHVTVIGGGFLGSEVALALASRGRDKDVQVFHVYAEKGPMQRLLPPYLTTYLQQRLKQAGVTPVGERLVTDFRYNSDTKRMEVALQGWAKRTLETDYIVLASTHIEPKVDDARESGLEIDQSNGGIVVNGLFEAVNGVYAAGNLASYFDPALGRRRIGSYDHSVNSGLCAGYNMAATLKAAQNDHVLAGKDTKSNSSSTSLGWSINPGETRRAPPGPHPRSYNHQPIWRSNLMDCDIVIEGVGETDARLRTVGMWVDRSEDWDGEDEDVVSFRDREPVYQRGIVYYLRGDKVAGILLFNTSDLLERAREVLRAQPTIKNMKQLKRQIPLAPDDWMRLEETPGSIRLRDEILTPPF